MGGDPQRERERKEKKERERTVLQLQTTDTERGRERVQNRDEMREMQDATDDIDRRSNMNNARARTTNIEMH